MDSTYTASATGKDVPSQNFSILLGETYRSDTHRDGVGYKTISAPAVVQPAARRVDATFEGLLALSFFALLVLGLFGYKQYTTTRARVRRRQIEKLEKLWRINA